jgi:hypothetical protein
MKSRLILLLLAAHAGTALAQYKCTGANGAITFQQTPCIGARSEEKLVVIPNGHPSPVAGTAARPPDGNTGADTDKRMQVNYDQQRRREPLEQALRKAQDEKARRAAQRTEAVAAAKKQFGGFPDTAAALRDALADIDSRYSALGQIDDGRIKAAQDALDEWERAQAGARPAAAR